MYKNTYYSVCLGCNNPNVSYIYDVFHLSFIQCGIKNVLKSFKLDLLKLVDTLL